MNYKLVAAFGIALVAGCSVSNTGMFQSTNANAGGSGGGSGAVCECGDIDGARLKVQWLTGSDGSRMRKANFWTDTERNESCAFQSFPNGETRCVPPHSTSNVYLDSSCTIPFYAYKESTAACVAPAKLVRYDGFDYSDLTCGAKMTGFRIYGVDTKDPYLGVPGWYTKDPIGDCVYGSSSNGYTLYRIYEVGSEKDFVLSSSEGF